ncbi:MAG: hypothetical protein A3F94_00720 [Candidatus Spechtbacteria bacterium RIFCSPLOWO2_12_FULL_38_22]|uniref:VTT domain-containing protein n=1 Tax=Candidatus Spechtbacteria bacterium RIFCSPLOWO2_12_FULL_38_22 TaxID=1802165 RepID=A0A1G2HHN4_9BACT|nr:MAG: hypothetical protein A2728_00965 [Candidatus Spechtbacteria bacterium RIFCSPHIGHO2_01_FULL_38_11]OGZ59312.1 MAG: hypothetical protein A3E58_02870 [Candidatus Spechtbacteria bacterium RIFCSPHIGHO2_12_FULL_38_30]OGZ59493.1 MAG: hypothetical protein A3A00_02715 [Candidatus Spechtbacteria bacterium RIFCSPLOWO2_01_FULL_38_20]OGZ61997.1 MAG: hypothetical protein A3F94_00720 [Candidatus Spechtbacteria bacterium RIFCSPLOWO2_12_FULL_38_22]
MINAVVTWLSALVMRTIESSGYLGVTVLMVLESANIPIPSEIIMPFSGFLVTRGIFVLWLLIVVGALGNLVGSLLSYYLGVYGGRKFLEKYGRFIFIHKRDIELADKLFARWGSSVVFFSRILPIVRTFISFPAGIARMNIWKFSFYTLAGSLIWSALLAYVGFWAGENWHFLSPYFRKFDWLIVSLVLVGTVWWVTRYVRKIRDNG